MNLCEGGFVRSPEGKTIALLLRENSRHHNSQIMFSGDEGNTWTPPTELPAALCGDRHQILPLPDGRLLVQFRDVPPTRKDVYKRQVFRVWFTPFIPLFQPQCRTRLKKSRHAAGSRFKNSRT